MDKGSVSYDEKNWDAVLQACKLKTDFLDLGLYYSHMISTDIKHLAFTLSRYKFVSKLLMYRDSVDLLELGCQEALGALMFSQNTKLHSYVGIDLDEGAIKWNQEYMPQDFEFICGNFFDYKKAEGKEFNAVVSLDVIEHISADMENEYCNVIYDNLKEDGVAVVGTPNIMLDPYACEESKIGHINLYDQERLHKLMANYFKNVFIFNMNDEMVNTGFAPMSCYIFAVCCNKR
ncbi:MAG: class I SAM-dependent methyltransferase [Lachnospiraceae bacterium]|nr:class I SAM-dependent methyltransferase [Lachnospiraceae bacterium]